MTSATATRPPTATARRPDPASARQVGSDKGRPVPLRRWSVAELIARATASPPPPHGRRLAEGTASRL